MRDVNFGNVCVVDGRAEWTLLDLGQVVVCLEITDLLFAVDSVSAIIAQIPDSCFRALA